MIDQKRNYSRVETFLPGRLRILTSEEEQSLYYGLSESELPQSMVKPKGSGLPETLLAYLETINAKLDMLLSIASQDRLQKNFPVNIHVVELSGAGLIFTADRKFALNDRVELIIFLSQVPLRISGAFGRIHRRDEVNAKPAWVVDFTSIKESDREAIVQFVFRQQREQIRESKQWT